jgi:hypothetical protein
MKIKDALYAKRRTHKTTILIYLVVACVFLFMHLFIFRDLVGAFPSIQKGESVVVREEMIPFYSFDSQFWSPDTSKLTGSDELRVNYSFWTSWVRHFEVVPFAMVLLNALSALILFHALFKIGKYFARDLPMVAIGAFGAAALIHLILLYSKSTHFYTLVFGFSMFAWSLSLVLEQLYIHKKLELRNVFSVSAVTLLNPAIHYHVIFYFIFAIMILVHLAFRFIVDKVSVGSEIAKSLKYFGYVIALSLIPYVIYIYLTTMRGVESVSTQIPVNYEMIENTSVPLPFLFSFDTASQVDMFRHGSYLVPSPRITTIIISVLIGLIFISPQFQRQTRHAKSFVISIFLLMLIAMWMSIGYSPGSDFSFHAILQNLASFLYTQGNAFATTIANLMSSFINILRFPHRFQFIYFYMAGVLLVISLAWLGDIIDRLVKRRFVTGAILIMITFIPIFGSYDYRTTLSSGDFNGFFKPYPIPQDLRNIKEVLGERSDDKLFLLPTLESGRDIKSAGQQFGFIDKFYIYYLNQPTFYYGTGANVERKVAAALVYKGIDSQSSWWDDVLADNLEITHILYPKHTVLRENGITFMPQVDSKIAGSLNNSDRYKVRYEGSEYVLYESVRPRQSNADATMVNMRWNNLRGFLSAQSTPDSLYFPLQTKNFLKDKENKRLATDSIEGSFYDLDSAVHKDHKFLPNANNIAFDKEVIPSSSFTVNALSVSVLDNRRSALNPLSQRLPSLVNMTSGQFIGLPKGKGDLDIKFRVASEGKYRLSMNIASPLSKITAYIDGSKKTFERIDNVVEDGTIDFSYYSVDMDVGVGKHTLTVPNSTKGAILVESLNVLPSSDFPRITDTELLSPDLDIRRLQQSELYEVDIKKR